MQLQQIFDKLLDAREIHLRLDKTKAESLRVMLSKRWNRWKQEMDSVGALDAEFVDLILSKEYNKEEGIVSYYIRPRQERQLTDYELIELPPRS